MRDEIVQSILLNEEMQKMPIGCQATALGVFEEAMKKLVEENPNATVSELF